MDFCFRFWVAGVGLSAAQETPGFRSYLTPTPATLTKLTIIHERTQHDRSLQRTLTVLAISRQKGTLRGFVCLWLTLYPHLHCG